MSQFAWGGNLLKSNKGQQYRDIVLEKKLQRRNKYLKDNKNNVKFIILILRSTNLNNLIKY